MCSRSAAHESCASRRSLLSPSLAAGCAATLSAILSFASIAGASARTVDVYDFTQDGYTDSITGPTNVLTGTFTGTVEPDGLIELADLASISVTFMGVTYHGPASFFSFNTMGGSSSLDLILPSGAICVGAAAAFGADFCGVGGVNGYIYDHSVGLPFTTQELPTVTLVSSMTVPEPSTWAMTLAGFAALGLAARRRRCAATAA